MRAIALNNIPLFENNNFFCAEVGVEYEYTINDNKVEIKQSDGGKFIIEIDLERFNMIFIDKYEQLRQKRQSKLKRII